jgi:hypothetical protein
MVGVMKKLKLKAVEYDSLPGGSKRDCPLDSVQTDIGAKLISSSMRTGCRLQSLR